jgi:hypothetical protein
METKFINFIKENINENKVYRSYKVFIGDVRRALTADFKNTRNQAIEYIDLYEDLFKQLWQNGFTPREAIAATKRPGFKIDDDNIDESIFYDIDDEFDTIYEKLKNSKSKDIIDDINGYYSKYSTISYSDKRITERVKNNYTNLLNLYKEKFEY